MITSIEGVIYFSKDSKLDYLYDAIGNKLRQDVIEAKNLTKRTDFISNFVIINNAPAWNNFDEGRVVYNTNGTYFAETFLKDHLGNIRVAFGFDGIKYAVRQVNSYYPFGMNIKELSANSNSTVHRNEYLYNGKMMQDEMGLGWLDYGARFYDPVLGRWHVMDPLAEKYDSWSPYNYAINNPILFIDPDGRDVEISKNEEEKKVTVRANFYYNAKQIDPNGEYGSVAALTDVINSWAS